MEGSVELGLYLPSFNNYRWCVISFTTCRLKGPWVSLSGPQYIHLEPNNSAGLSSLSLGRRAYCMLNDKVTIFKHYKFSKSGYTSTISA